VNLRSELHLAIKHSFNIVEHDGHWYGELKSNPTITAEYIFLRRSFGLDLASDKEALCNWLYSQQNTDGSWGLAPEYPGDVSTSVEVYLALKILGVGVEEPRMCHARDTILKLGGIAKVRIFTRIYLATFGLFFWDAVPQLPAELILMPSFAPINIYGLSSWARSTVVPLLIVAHHRPIYALPNGMSPDNKFLDELWCNTTNKLVPYALPLSKLWKKDFVACAFSAVDNILYYLGGLRGFPLRSMSRRQCIEFVLEHQEESGDTGGIFPAMGFSTIVLLLEGYKLEDREVILAFEAIERFTWQDHCGKRIQACVSPVWDTVLMSIALCDSGLNRNQPQLVQAVNWVKKRQILGPEGDWRIYCPNTPPGGFSFEYFNTWYPDVDDTAAAILAFLNKTPSQSAQRS
jgi:squalene-hopene/tetraprenyl-beta-curcumene cyclase